LKTPKAAKKVGQNDLIDPEQKNYANYNSVGKYGDNPYEERKVNPKMPSASHRNMPF
jgi:hypothetical protein